MTVRDRLRRYTIRHARPCPGGCGGVVLSRHAHYCRSCSKRLVRAAGRVRCRLSADDKRTMAHAAAVALLQQHEPVLLQVFGGWVDPPPPEGNLPRAGFVCAAGPDYRYGVQAGAGDAADDHAAVFMSVPAGVRGERAKRFARAL